jgi:hypothetical protein
MRRALVLGALGALALAGCEPDITAGSYYCGEEMACPETLRCDGLTAECVYPDDAEPFVCPPGSNELEPDDALDAPGSLGTRGCGLAVTELGCVDTSADVDHLAFTTPAGCTGTLELRVRYSLAFAGLELDLLDPDGTVIAAGDDCGLDTAAQLTTCLSTTATPDTDYVIRIRIPDGTPDCDGLCSFNRYQLSIL